MRCTRLASGVVVLLTLGLAMGCGRGADSTPAATGHTARLQPAKESASDEADYVSAVSAAGPVAPVGLKFKVASPPRVGQSLRIDLALNQQPGLDIDSLLISLQAGDGLVIESDRSFEIQSPAPGATQHLGVTVRAEQQGLLSLRATVLVSTANASLTRSFSVPLIATP